MLTQTILQSPYQAPLNDPYFYLRALKFLVASNVQIVITFALFWQNQSNYIFQKVRLSLSKRDISRFCCHTVIYAFWRFFFFFFFAKYKMLTDLFFHFAKLWAKILHGWKLEVNRIILLQISNRRTCCFLLLILAYVTCMNLFDRYFSTSHIPCIYFIIRNIHKRIWSSEKLRLLNFWILVDGAWNTFGQKFY